ncbi:MAG TPA: hypothetical protein VFA33_21820 [Bryobacteraceae bacterium]|nr:hypothetical protein [Bryobacteraceae bacterium]
MFSNHFGTSVFLVLLLASPLLADDNEAARWSLRGIEAVDVVIPDLDEAAQNAGITSEQLRTDVELKLRMAGIKVQSDLRIRSGMPRLCVGLVMLDDRAGGYSAMITVELEQQVQLVRMPEKGVILATTWSVLTVATVGSSNAVRYIREGIRDKVDRFVNAYLSANPK